MKGVAFSIEEENVIAIYRGKTRAVTITSMRNISKYVQDKQMQSVINRAADKLSRISDDEFNRMDFVFTE